MREVLEEQRGGQDGVVDRMKEDSSEEEEEEEEEAKHRHMSDVHKLGRRQSV